MELSEKTSKRLKSKYGEWALVTGATSGLGKYIALALAKSGLNLVINARNHNQLQVIAKEWQREYDIKIEIIAEDLSTINGVLNLIEKTSTINIGLVVQAAGFGTSGAFITNSLEAELNMIDVNCKAVVMLSHEFAKRFKKQQRGGFIMFSSIVAFQGTPLSANYAATKAFVQTFSEGLQIELKPYEIDVLIATPGPVNTNFGNRANMKMDNAESPELVATDILRALGKQRSVVPGRIGKFLTYSLRLLPRWGKIKVMTKVMRGMAIHQ